MISRTMSARHKRMFPIYNKESTEKIFRPDVQVLETGDYIIGHLNGEIILGRITIKRKVIKSDITVRLHTGKRIGNKKELITISNIICFTRKLTPKQLKEELPEFFI